MVGFQPHLSILSSSFRADGRTLKKSWRPFDGSALRPRFPFGSRLDVGIHRGVAQLFLIGCCWSAVAFDLLFDSSCLCFLKQKVLCLAGHDSATGVGRARGGARDL